MDKRIRMYLVLLACLILVGWGTAAITQTTGISEPSLPIIGGTPFIGAFVLLMVFIYWAKKELQKTG